VSSMNGALSEAVGRNAADGARLAEMLETSRGSLLRYFSKKGVPLDEAADLTQETLVRAFVHLERHGQTREDLGPLVSTIARNLVVERARRAPTATVSLGEGVDMVDPSDGPEEVVLVSERRAAVRRAVSALAPRHRRVVSLWMEGCTPGEIARELGIKRNAADALLHRARRALASRLEGNLPGLAVPGVLVALWGKLRRTAASLGQLGPTSAPLAPMAGAVALAGTAVVLSLSIPLLDPAAAPSSRGEADANSASYRSEDGARPGETPAGEPADSRASEDSGVPTSSGVSVDLRNHSGFAGAGWTDGEGEDQFVGVEWEVEIDETRDRALSEDVLEKVEQVCDQLSPLCDSLTP
jgi:RNA polymerase sigma factor (sigma-70 family)